MRAHVIEGGRIVNTVVVASFDVLPGLALVDAEQHPGNIGDGWDGTEVVPAAPTPLTLEDMKTARAAEVAAIMVTTSAGHGFDGDERSQDRMTRAITAMESGDSLPWVLHDNTVVFVSRSELQEALRLAGAAMAAIWIRPYEEAGS